MRRLFVLVLALVPLPFATALVADGEARRLPRAVVEARAGDLFLGALQLTRGRALDGEPDWSPDMRRIAFVRQEPGRRGSSLYVIRRNGGGLERLTRGEQVVAMPAWSPNGRTIPYAASPLAGGSFDIWAITARDGRPFSCEGRAGRGDRAALESRRAGVAPAG